MQQFCSDVKAMLGFGPGLYWQVCWGVVSPATLAVRNGSFPHHRFLCH